MDLRAAVTEVFEPGPPFGDRIQRLSPRVVLPRHRWFDLGQPFPGLPHPTRHEIARHPEGAVPDEPLTYRIAGVQDLDRHPRRGGAARPPIPEQLPYLGWRAVDDHGVLVFLHQVGGPSPASFTETRRP